MKGTNRSGLSRREFLGGVSAIAGATIASPALAQITTMAPFEKLPPYGNNTLPAGVRPRLVPNVNGLTVNMPTDGLELALDPRLPPESQAFRFLLDGVNPGDTVSWTIDNGIETSTGPGYIWPVTRGPHRVADEIRRDGATIANLDPIEFLVR